MILKEEKRKIRRQCKKKNVKLTFEKDQTKGKGKTHEVDEKAYQYQMRSSSLFLYPFRFLLAERIIHELVFIPPLMPQPKGIPIPRHPTCPYKHFCQLAQMIQLTSPQTFLLRPPLPILHGQNTLSKKNLRIMNHYHL